MRRFRVFYFLVVLLLGIGVPALRAQDTTPSPEPIPDPIPLVDEGGDDIVNVLLIGSATSNPENPGMSDSLMIVSVNRTAGAVSVVSIPRDIWVNVPGFGMNKINTAYLYGETREVEGGGIGLLSETIRYNLGLNVDYWARADFNGFDHIIDAVGGIDITVDCTIQDWKLKSPELDKQVEDNWEMFTLDAGRHHLDGELALWYVRSRRTSSDLDRGRRQQDVLRALWRRVRQSNLLETLPAAWETFSQSVTTNLTLADIAGMTPLALALDTSEVQYYTFRQRHEIRNGFSADGQQILVMEREAVAELMQSVVRPPNPSQVYAEPPIVAIVNASGSEDMPYVAADRLELEGFRAVILNEPTSPRNFNHIVDYTGGTKGNPVGEIQRVLRVTDDGVQVEPDPNREYDYRVYIGAMYQFWTCTRDVIQPTMTPTLGG